MPKETGETLCETQGKVRGNGVGGRGAWHVENAAYRDFLST